MIEVTRVDYIRVPVDDIEKATHFYGEVLGLPRNPHLDHEDWIEYYLRDEGIGTSLCGG